MKLKKPNPGNGKCDAMRCTQRPTFQHQLQDATVVELCERHDKVAQKEYG
jgi:hypothetical protein